MSHTESPKETPHGSLDELLPLVDADGNRIGQARRREVHGNPYLLHPVVHCLVCDARGGLLLQLRSASKDVQPGRWDTSVGGHVGVDEAVESAVVREIEEEIGVRVEFSDLRFLHRYVMKSAVESELVHTFATTHPGPFRAEPGDIDALRFWKIDEIQTALGSGQFTPNFEEEFARYLAHRR